MTEDFSYWQGQLAGQNPPLPDLMPQPGCYRDRDDPVMIRVQGDEMFAWFGRKGQQKRVLADAGFAETRFSFFCRNAIPSKLYDEVTNHGAAWPDEIESLDEARSNFPSDPYQALLAELELLEMKIEQFFETPVAIGDHNRGSQADKWKCRAAKLYSDIEALRKIEAKPFDDGKAAVQAKFKPHLARANDLKTAATDGMSAYQFAKDDAERDAKRRAREAELEAAKAMDEPPPPEKATRGRSMVATGNTTVVRRKVGVITDLAVVAAFYIGQPNPWPDLVEMLRKMAEKNLKAGTAVPGAELREERSVR